MNSAGHEAQHKTRGLEAKQRKKTVANFISPSNKEIPVGEKGGAVPSSVENYRESRKLSLLAVHKLGIIITLLL